ncbi:polyphosphate polymerase domain-containing protein [Candidatus Saccharibacteria bacterium]|nr:polyphosphate polymerase domain-containing protein [Candidatus Saccharibacteria bacterium]
MEQKPPLKLKNATHKNPSSAFKVVSTGENLVDDRTIERTEEKYLISKSTKTNLLKLISKHLEKDQSIKEQVLRLYFDTKHSDLALRSMERPEFREKIRVRAYNVPKRSSPVFFEVKSKVDLGLKKLGNKRRLVLPLKDFYAFLNKGENLELLAARASENDPQQLQVARELTYLFSYYQLEPKVIVSADRTAYTEKNNINFRLTFDERLRFRETDLRLEKGSAGEKFFSGPNKSEENIVMEVKTMNSMPLWFVSALSELKIYSVRFSKYGKIYQLITERNKNHV